jgi:hypothetical protein
VQRAGAERIGHRGVGGEQAEGCRRVLTDDLVVAQRRCDCPARPHAGVGIGGVAAGGGPHRVDVVEVAGGRIGDGRGEAQVVVGDGPLGGRRVGHLAEAEVIARYCKVVIDDGLFSSIWNASS